MTVGLTRSGDDIATLFVPGKGTIDIKGENRIEIIQRLVDAHNNGPMPMATKDLVKESPKTSPCRTSSSSRCGTS